MKEFTKPLLREIRVDLDAALATVAAKYGIELRAGNCSFTANTITWKVEGAVPGESKERGYYRANREWLGLPELGAQFTARTGKHFTIVGLNRACSKVVIDDDAGKHYLMPVDAVKAYFPAVAA